MVEVAEGDAVALDLRSGLGRADLLRALVHGGEDALVGGAALLGYADTAKKRPDDAADTGKPKGEDTADGSEPSVSDDAPTDRPTPFWRLETMEFPDPEGDGLALDRQPAARALHPTHLGRLRGTPPARAPIAPAAALHAAFDRMLVSRLPGRRLDTDWIVDALSRGRGLDTLPYLTTPGWNPRLLLLVDRSRRLVPFWEDQRQIVDRLVAVLGRGAVRVWGWLERRGGRWRNRNGAWAERIDARPGESVLLLSDLGFLGGARDRRAWLHAARRLRPRAARLAALVPVPRDRWDTAVADPWNAVDWSTPARAGRRPPRPREAVEARRDRLATLASIATRIETGLLRDLRRLLGGDADLATEADVWNHPDMARTAANGAQLGSRAQTRLRAAFRGLSPDLKARAVEVLKRWRAGTREELYWEEVLALSGDADLDDALAADRQRAGAFARQLPATLRAGRHDAFHDEVGSWVRRVGRRFPGALVWQDPEVGAALTEAWQTAWEGFESPPVAEGMRLPPGQHGEQAWYLDQLGDGLVLRGRDIAERSPLGVISASGPIQIGDVMASAVLPDATLRVDLPRAPELILRTDRSTATLRRIVRPPWADAMGRDRFGLWARFTVEGISQRMRWIPPDSFWMGSPEDEEGRYPDEGPRHRVEIEQGFWLAETPCTQALWQVVMGTNPSGFQSPDRPVESVSWNDVQRFIAALGVSSPALAPRLPFEAEWEYACRAGTETATYAGPMEITGDGTAAVLADIAWYRENSDSDFELEEAHGAHPVARKVPNPWGLYDTLGNVREWCEDLWCDRYDQPRGGTRRVVRGGSWFNSARLVRAALRDHYSPSVRFVSLGFRLARGPALKPGVEPGGDARASGGPGSRRSRRKGPTWARASGRDRFGEWATIDVEGAELRMRRILPGRFWMGSPEDEPGRWADEGPRHEVRIERDFWIADTPCTQALWQAVMGQNPSRFRSSDRPVEMVSWDDCHTFLAELGERIPGLDPRLPLEAEWEYACRAGTETATHVGGNSQEELDVIAWCAKNSNNRTHGVAEKKPNAWGLYDMLGNVWEWCEDLWCGSYDQPRGGSLRVVRGGSWIDNARSVRAAYRNRIALSERSADLGFRLARGPFALQQGPPRRQP